MNEAARKALRASLPERMEKAGQCADMLVWDLREALAAANPVEGLVVLDMISSAAALAGQIKRLGGAMSEGAAS